MEKGIASDGKHIKNPIFSASVPRGIQMGVNAVNGKKQCQITEASNATSAKIKIRSSIMKRIDSELVLVIKDKITCWKNLGFDGVCVMVFSLSISGLFFYIANLYTKNFTTLQRPFVWVFMLFGSLYTGLSLIYLYGWKQIAVEYIHKERRSSATDMTERKNVYTRTIRPVLVLRKKFYINGDLFLWKLYGFEFIESINQIYNFLTLYLCTLPVAITSTIGILLAFDALYRAYLLTKPNTVQRRDCQVKIDLFMDFFCMALPIGVLWFVYDIGLSIPEMLSLTGWPSFNFFSKLRSILREIIRVRAYAAVRKEQDVIISKHRDIVYVKTKDVVISEQQEKLMPKYISKCFSAYSIIYGLFFFVVAIVHLVKNTSLNNCNHKTWEVGCKNKIPFCGFNIFTPKCNCAYLDIRNDNKLTALPNGLVGEMSGLRKLYIKKCNLTFLPLQMERLTEITSCTIIHNKLESFHVDILQWKKLNELVLHHNKIKAYNEKSLWSHPTLTYLDISYNIAIKVPSPEIKIFMPFLTMLAFSNNDVEITNKFDTTHFPMLVDLYLNGNTFATFPDVSLRETLQFLGVSRSKLKRFPQYLPKFYKLKYLDARDNNISSINSNLKTLIKKNQMEAYFSGNSVCKTSDELSLNCKPLCSKYCWSSTELNNGHCDYTCNSKECEYDGGDCGSDDV